MVKDYERYVKVSGSERLHSTLFRIAESCSRLTSETNDLKVLESQKHKIYAEARSASRSLLSDIKGLNASLVTPTKFVLNNNAPAAKRKAARPRPKPRRVTPARRGRPVKKVAPRRAKAQPKRAASAKRGNPVKKAAKPKMAETENLRRLKSNLDAIRASLK